MSLPTTTTTTNNTIRIAVNGVVHLLDAHDILSKRPYLKLSEYLREDLHLTGTKVACGEGGCGGCTVLITRMESGGGLTTVSCNACLAPLTSLHNAAITTVEGIYDASSPSTQQQQQDGVVAGAEGDFNMYDRLTVPSGNYEPITTANAGPDAALSTRVEGRRPHPIQQRFASYNASQCGFCTPGFVMAVCGFLCKQGGQSSTSTPAPSSSFQLADIEDALDGNLCRCTGYRPILEAAAGTAITECHGDRKPDAACAKCVSCPRAQQCLPDGAHENTLEEARGVLKLVEGSFPFHDIASTSQPTSTHQHVTTTLLPPKMPVAPHTVAARSNTITAAIQGGKPASALLNAIPVTTPGGATTSSPPVAFGYHTFPKTVEELVSAIQAIDTPEGVSLVAAQTSAGVYPQHLPVKISKAAVANATNTTSPASAPPSVISLQYVDELGRVEPWVGGSGEEGITVGATTTISQLVGHLMYHALWLHSTGTNDDAKMTILRAATIIKTIAGTHVRDVATIGGNLSMCRNLGFASDLATPLCALNAVATVVDVTHGGGGVSVVRRSEPLSIFLSTSNPKVTTVLVSVSVPIVKASAGSPSVHTNTYFHRVATRSANAHAILNAACTIQHNTTVITGVSVVLGNAGVMDVPHSNAPKAVPVDQLASLLVGKPLSVDTIVSFKNAFHAPNGLIEGDYKAAARVMLVKAFIVASLEGAANASNTTTTTTKSFTQLYPSDQGHVFNPTTAKHSEPSMVVGRPISKPDGILHATGTTTYLTDISPPKGTLYMSIVMSTVPSGIVKKFGTDALIPLQALNNKSGGDGAHQPASTVIATAEEPTTALILPDQKRLQFPLFIGAADLPPWALNRHPDIGGHLGEQDRKGAFPGGYYDFPLVANRLIAYCDQPIGVVIGRTLKEAELGAKAVAAATTYQDVVPSASPTFPAHLPKVPSILGGRYEGLPIAAIRKHSIKMPEAPETSQSSTSEKEGGGTTTAVDFETVLLGQKHFYMENQACLVIPADGATRAKVHLAVHGVQHAGEFVAKAAGYAMNQVEIVQHRMGGSFGGKTNVVHACLAAILSRMYHRPVMVALDRITDMRFQGGREEMQIRSKVVTSTSTPSKTNEFNHIVYNALDGTHNQSVPRILSVDTTTHADVGARVGFSNYTLGSVMPYSIMRCYSPSSSVDNTAIGYLTQSCERTNVRSPGHAEAAIITEAIIDRVAAAHNVHSQVVREANFLGSDAALIKPYSKTMYTFPGLYKKMMAVGASTTSTKDGEKDGWASRINATIDFNKEHVGGRYKKGAAVVPFEYPVGGGQYSAMVVVLPDGSVAVHHSGVEMGQGLVIKSLQAANQELSKILHQLCEGASDEHGNPKQMSALPMSLFQSAGNSSHVLPKHGITGGSTSSEGSVDAVVEAAKKIAEMLEPFVCMLFGSEVDIPEEEVDTNTTTFTAEEDVLGEYTSLAQTTGASNDTSTKRQIQLLRAQLRRGEFETHTLWARLVALANSMGAHLTASAMNGEESGSSSYSIYCVGGAEVTVDTYTGAVVVDRVDIMYDAGRSLNPAVDIGQIEGAFIMGLGYMLTEENAHHDIATGEEVSKGSTWNYKVPSIRELPTQFNVQLMSPGDLDRWLMVNRDHTVVEPKDEDGEQQQVEEVAATTTNNANAPACKSNGGKGLVMSSKATGEPPLCIAPCLLSAVRQAVQSSRRDKDLGGYPAISVPYTPDKVVRACGAM